MNSKERVEWQKAVGACCPDLDLGPMTAASEALERAAPGRWEISVGGGGLHLAGLRYHGTRESDFPSWQAAALKAFGFGPGLLADAPPPGVPWLSASWDLRAGARTALRFYGAGSQRGSARVFDFAAGETAPTRRTLKPAAFKSGVFKEEALDRALEDFSRLCPLDTIAIADPGWSLRFAQPLRWPLFARCDVAAAFTPHSSQLGLFLLDRKVVELSFDGEALWAHCAG